MMDGHIDPKDLAELHFALDGIQPKKVLSFQEWRKFLTPLRRLLRTYPPKLPGQKYVRTYNLKRNWKYVVLKPEHAEIGNAAEYAGWVQGVDQNEEFHKDRWPVAVKVADEAFEKWIKVLSRKIGRIWTK